MSSSPIRNLLFDLGGVLYQIDFPKTRNAFEAIQPQQSQKGETVLKHPAFTQLDSGQIDISTWAQSLKESYNWEVETEKIMTIWRELLVGPYPGRFAQIDTLSTHYSIGLLSNTCHFHYEHYIDECRPMFEKMEHLFFSFNMSLTKPAKGIYQQVLEQTGWNPSETLFLDDSPKNLEGAATVGMQTFLVDKPEKVDAIVAELLTGKQAV